MRKAKEKRDATVAGVLLLVALVLASAGPVLAAEPILPDSFYGSLTVNGGPAPAGVTIVAKIAGVERGRYTTDQVGAYGYAGAGNPKLIVEGVTGDIGKEIHFYIENYDGTLILASNDPAPIFESGADPREVGLTFVGVVLADFSIGVSPTSGSVVQGGSTSATVSVSSIGIGGFSSAVSLSASGLPSGATASFSPSSRTPSFTSTVTISTASTTPAGTYNITITGTGGGKTHTCNFALTVTTVVVPGVPDFSISVSPTSGSAVQGGSTSATVSVSSIEGFSSTVSLSSSGFPSGTTATLTPPSGTPSFTSTLTISTSPTAPTGTYSMTITGTGGGKTHSATYTLTVTAVVPRKATLTVDTTPIKARVYVDGILWGTAPQTRPVDVGAHVVSFGDRLGYLAPAPQTVALAENETRTVTGTYTVIPPENVENQSPTYELPSLTAGENATVHVENTAISEITLEAENDISGARITVQQFTDRPADIAIGAPGATYKYLNIVAENVTDAQVRSVTIRFGVEKSWMTANRIDISTITLNRYDPATGEWTPLPTTFLSEDDTYAYFSAVSPGLSVFGISGQPLQPDFSISVSPTSGSVVQGGSAVATVSITSIGGFTDTVSLSASGLPSGATAAFSPLSGTPSFTSALTISTSATTPSGAYTITITGTGGGKTHSCEFALTITTVIVPGVPDFSMEVSPTSGSVAQGGARTATVSVSPIEGFAERVSLFASGLPSGAAASFAPTSGAPSFDSALTISTSATTPTGTYTITITGTGGGKTHSATFSLTVTAAPPPSALIPLGIGAGIVIIAIIVISSLLGVGPFRRKHKHRGRE